MKVRNGFVSNSSSNSFVIITTKENHEKTLSNLHPFAAAVIRAIVSQKDHKFGKDLVYIGTLDTPSGSVTFDDLDIDFDGEKPDRYEVDGDYVAFEEYKDDLSKNNNDDVLKISIDG
jgi:hypothetical protein